MTAVSTAINFSHTHRYKLYLLVLPVLAADLIISILSSELVPRMISGLLKTYAFVLVFNYSIKAYQGSPYKYSELCRKAFGALPKVFIAYFLLAFVMSFVTFLYGSSVFALFDSRIAIGFFPITLILTVVFSLFSAFFVWAPLFCAGEELATEGALSNFFSSKQPYEVGLARSSALFVNSKELSLLAAGLCLAAITLPEAIIPASGFSVVLFYPLLARFGAMTTILFVNALPKESRKELGFESLDETKPGFNSRLTLGVVAVAIVCAPVFYYYSAISKALVPDNVSFYLTDINRIGEELQLEIGVTETGDWLIDDQIRAYYFDELQEDWFNLKARSQATVLRKVPATVESTTYGSTLTSFIAPQEKGYVVLSYETQLSEPHLIAVIDLEKESEL